MAPVGKILLEDGGYLLLEDGGTFLLQGVLSVFSVSGVSAQGLVGEVNLAGWTTILDAQTPSWSNVTDMQTPGWVNVGDTQTPAWADITV